MISILLRWDIVPLDSALAETTVSYVPPIFASCAFFATITGAQVNERTNGGIGGTALYWAEKRPKENKAAIKVLKKYGAINVKPGAPAVEEKDDGGTQSTKQ